MNELLCTILKKNNAIKIRSNNTIAAPWQKLDSIAVCPLLHDDVLCIKGEDAHKFLQGQMTCDISVLADYDFCLGACCNHKGRMIANFRVVKFSETEYYLVLPKGQAKNLISYLQKYTIFYKVFLNEVVDEIFRIGLYQHNNSIDEKIAKIIKKVIYIPFDSFTGELWFKKDMLDWLKQFFSENLNWLSTQQWQWLDIQKGIPWVSSLFSELFIPQECNWDLVNGISFKKGCYTGQEIIARLHYRGKVKKRVFYYICDSNVEIDINNCKIIGQDNKNYGSILNSVYDSGSKTFHLLVSLKVDDAQKQLYVSDYNLNVNLKELPYKIN